MEFGDYIIFVDESGDQSLKSIDAKYPVFVLSFCIFEKKDYCSTVVPNMLRFKFDFFGTDIPILHEREIRKRENDFSILMDSSIREEFFARLNTIMSESQYLVVSTLIDKQKYREYRAPSNPYEISVQFGIERVFYEMQLRNQRGKTIPVVFESRGNREDAALKTALKRIMSVTSIRGMSDMFEFHFVNKKANLQGLQLADLIARPIGNHYLHPEQHNRAWSMLLPKMRTSPEGKLEGYGLKIYPNRNHHQVQPKSVG